jgi:hypothetical protein
MLTLAGIVVTVDDKPCDLGHYQAVIRDIDTPRTNEDSTRLYSHLAVIEQALAVILSVVVS